MLRAAALYIVEGIVLGAIGWVGYRLLVGAARRMDARWTRAHTRTWGYLRFALVATVITAAGSTIAGHEFVWLYPVALLLLVTGVGAAIGARFAARRPPSAGA